MSNNKQIIDDYNKCIERGFTRDDALVFTSYLNSCTISYIKHLVNINYDAN